MLTSVLMKNIQQQKIMKISIVWYFYISYGKVEKLSKVYQEKHVFATKSRICLSEKRDFRAYISIQTVYHIFPFWRFNMHTNKMLQ